MGTRGFVGVAVDDQVKVSYNHWDSYPDELGVKTLGFVRDAVQGFPEELLRQARELRLVDEDGQPTKKDIATFYGYSDTNVSTGQVTEWYVLLRNLQGELGEMLRLGIMIDSRHFPLDSLFCEWGYLLDLDNELFEVYEGFSKEPVTEGRWAGRPTDVERKEFRLNDAYYAVHRVKYWPLTELPTAARFLNTFDGKWTPSIS